MPEKFYGDFPKKIIIDDKTVVKAEDELLPLCSMCKKSRLICENTYMRDVEVPMEKGDLPELEIIEEVKRPNGEFEKRRTGLKWVDGVKEGMYKTEEDIPMPFVCEWLELKDS